MTVLLRTLEYGSPTLQVFLYLQLLDALTTLLGFRIGLSEASPFVQFLIQVGPAMGLLISKLIAVGLSAFCIWSGRMHVIRWINYWYASLILWNFLLILSQLR